MEAGVHAHVVPATALFDRLAMSFGTHPDLLRRVLSDTRECEKELRAHFAALRECLAAREEELLNVLHATQDAVASALGSCGRTEKSTAGPAPALPDASKKLVLYNGQLEDLRADLRAFGELDVGEMSDSALSPSISLRSLPDSLIEDAYFSRNLSGVPSTHESDGAVAVAAPRAPPFTPSPPVHSTHDPDSHALLLAAEIHALAASTDDAAAGSTDEASDPMWDSEPEPLHVHDTTTDDTLETVAEISATVAVPMDHNATNEAEPAAVVQPGEYYEHDIAQIVVTDADGHFVDDITALDDDDDEGESGQSPLELFAANPDDLNPFLSPEPTPRALSSELPMVPEEDETDEYWHVAVASTAMGSTVHDDGDDDESDQHSDPDALDDHAALDVSSASDEDGDSSAREEESDDGEATASAVQGAYVLNTLTVATTATANPAVGLTTSNTAEPVLPSPAPGPDMLASFGAAMEAVSDDDTKDESDGDSNTGTVGDGTLDGGVGAVVTGAAGAAGQAHMTHDSGESNQNDDSNDDGESGDDAPPPPPSAPPPGTPDLSTMRLVPAVTESRRLLDDARREAAAESAQDAAAAARIVAEESALRAAAEAKAASLRAETEAKALALLAEKAAAEAQASESMRRMSLAQQRTRPRADPEPEPEPEPAAVAASAQPPTEPEVRPSSTLSLPSPTPQASQPPAATLVPRPAQPRLSPSPEPVAPHFVQRRRISLPDIFTGAAPAVAPVQPKSPAPLSAATSPSPIPSAAVMGGVASATAIVGGAGVGDARARELQERMRQLDETDDDARKRAERVSAALAAGLRATMLVAEDKEKKKEPERLSYKERTALARASSLPTSAPVNADTSHVRPVTVVAGLWSASSEQQLNAAVTPSTVTGAGAEAAADEDTVVVPMRRNSVLWGSKAPTPIERRASMNFDSVGSGARPARPSSINFDALPSVVGLEGPPRRPSGLFGTATLPAGTPAAPVPPLAAADPSSATTDETGVPADTTAAVAVATTTMAAAAVDEDTVEVPMRRNSVLWGSKAPAPMDRRSSVSVLDIARRSSMLVNPPPPEEAVAKAEELSVVRQRAQQLEADRSRLEELEKSDVAVRLRARRQSFSGFRSDAPAAPIPAPTPAPTPSPAPQVSLAAAAAAAKLRAKAEAQAKAESFLKRWNK